MSRLPDLRPRAVLRAAVGGLAALALAAPATHAAASQRLLILGDSISQGTAGDVTWRYHLWSSLQAGSAAGTVDFVGARSGLFNYVAGTQDDNHLYAFPGFDQDHDAFWGRRLSTGASQIGSILGALPEKPTVAVVELGANDYSGGVAAATSQARKLIAGARAAAPGIDLVFVQPYTLWDPKSKNWIYRDYFQQFDAALASLASELNTADQRVTTAALPSFDARNDTWDGRHPNATGEVKLASSVSSALATIGIGDGPHLPASFTWPATAPAPTLTASGGRITVSWPDTTIGALAYGIQQQRTPAGGTPGAWTLVTQPARTVRSWTSGVYAPGDRYAYRVVPVRGLMSGTPGPAAELTIPGASATPTPTPTPTATPWKRPWWMWW